MDHTITTGGFTLLIEEGKASPPIFSGFTNTVLRFKNCREIEGPFINGIWAVHFDVDSNRPLSKQITEAKRKLDNACRRFFKE